MKIILICLFAFSSLVGFGQQPYFGLRLSSNEVSDGYTLFTPELNKNVYLIDNCGYIVNQWQFSERPALTCYLLENGNLLRAGRDSLEIRDWNNNEVWSYGTTANGLGQHHDIEPLPNGNILILSKETISTANITLLGRDPALNSDSLQMDVIYELQPFGTHGATVVWSWRFSDHLIQEFDNTKLNYGVVADHRELLDINFDNSQALDYTHCNAIDYNQNLDQVLITARHLSELLIIDHSTTEMEASSHTGGTSGKGGDFLYRWGNSQVYHQGSSTDQKLRLPHDGKWIADNCPDAGSLTVFNNFGNGIDQNSSIHIIAPEINAGVYQLSSSAYLPADYSWSWSGDILGGNVFETKKCGTMQLQSGNMMMAVNSTGTICEINPNGEVIWVYRNPTGTNGVIYQADNAGIIGDVTIFRGEKYGSNFPGFVGKDLTPIATIENNNSIAINCSTAGIEDNSFNDLVIINPVTDGKIEFNQSVEMDQLLVMNLAGKCIITIDNFTGNFTEINCVPGIYFMKMTKGSESFVQRLIVN